MAIPESPARKAILRSEMRRILRRLGGDSAAVVREAAAWLAARPQLRTAALYAALPGEVDLLGLMDTSRRWVFPKIDGEHLVFRQVRDPGADLSEGAFRIREPRDGLHTVDVAEIDVFFCPGLAFDSEGGRLGRGRGFYDRMLENARPDAVKVGVCFGAQRVQDTFAEPHDVRMDWILSEPL